MILYPYQKEGVSFLKARRAALLADEPGLGKTPQAICAADEVNKIYDYLTGGRILVLCPAIAKLNWQREIKIWSKNQPKIQVVNGRNDKIDPACGVVIVNYDLLISQSIFMQLIRLRFAVGIFDESHYLKSRTSKRTKAVLVRGAIASRCDYKWFLTGTPILNRPIELYPTLKAVVPHLIEPYASYDGFARRFCGAYWDGFQLVDKGATHVDDLCVRLNSGFMLRRLKKDVLTELPDKQYQMIQIPVANAGIKDLVKKEFTFSKGDARKVPVGSEGAEIARIRHELALAKLPTCVEHIKNVLDETDKIVIFCFHKDVIKLLAERLRGYFENKINREGQQVDDLKSRDQKSRGTIPASLPVCLRQGENRQREHNKDGKVERLYEMQASETWPKPINKIPPLDESEKLGETPQNPLRSQLGGHTHTGKMPAVGDTDCLEEKSEKNAQQPLNRPDTPEHGIFKNKHLGSELESQRVETRRGSQGIGAPGTEFQEEIVVVTGDTTSLQRQKSVDAFQNNKRCRVFIGQIQAAGVAITLTAASRVIFVESDWVPGIIDQAIDRCHRIGQKDAVLAQFLVIQDSLEEYMTRTMIDKKQVIADIIDQDPTIAEMFT